jgi:glycosyltransferase involved in cell wall biosynthesis
MHVTLSTVTPVYSGASYLLDLVSELEQLRNKWERENAPIKLVESIFVDDGSIDDSSRVLKELSAQYNWVRVITLSRNFGQHSATVAGICHTMSDWVVSLDEDLQHRPALIESLLSTAVEKNLDIVYAKPESSVHGGGWRDSASKFAKKLVAKLAGLKQIETFNSFRLLRGSVARAAASSASSQTYLDVALSWFSQSSDYLSVPMKDERFLNGKGSGYNLIGLLRHLRRLMVSSQLNIAKFGLGLGLLAILVSVVLGGNVLFSKLFYPVSIAAEGWASLAAIICAFSGIILALICILLEYINVLVQNQLGRPTFFSIDRGGDEVLSDWFSTKIDSADSVK